MDNSQELTEGIMETLNAVLSKWEPTWLLLVLLAETVVSLVMLQWIIKEYNYDKSKDDQKAQRKTKTTKKTTQPSGEIVEESTETSEPVREEKQTHV